MTGKDWYSPGDISLEPLCRQCFEDHWKWEDCPSKAIWYSPREIFFCSKQMMWLLTWLELLEKGKWPPEDKDTGYTGYTGSQGSIGHRAPFETPVGFSAEVNSRLKTTGEAGEALVDEIQGGITDYNGLSRPARRALNYISGWRQRKQTYLLAEWT